MASYGKQYKSIICPICNVNFSNPKALPCLHSFCCHCLDVYIKSRESLAAPGALKSFPCPVCRHLCQPSDPKLPVHTWAEGFPTNFSLADVVEELQSEGAVPQVEASQRECRIHPDHLVDSLCPRCEVLICDLCSPSHRSCGKLPTLEEALRGAKAERESLQETFLSKKGKLQETVREMEGKLSDLNLKKTRALDELKARNSRMTSLIERLMREEGDKVEEIATFYVEQKRELEDALQVHRELLKSFASCIELLDIPECESDCGFIAKFYPIKKQCLCHADADIPRLPTGKQFPYPVFLSAEQLHDLLEKSSWTPEGPEAPEDCCVPRRALTTRFKFKPERCPGEDFSWLYDIVALSNQVIAGTDQRHKKVKFFTNGCLQQTVVLNSTPWSIGRVSSVSVVVTVPDVSAILYLVLCHGKFRSEMVRCKKPYTGIAALGNERLACGCVCPPRVDILTCKGEILATITDHKGDRVPLFQNPNFLTAQVDGTVLVSDSGKRRLVCCSCSGVVKFIYSGNKETDYLTEPCGVSADQQGRIYLADKSRNMLHCLTSSGKISKLVYSDVEGLSYPMGMSITLDGNLAVTEWFGMVRFLILD